MTISDERIRQLLRDAAEPTEPERLGTEPARSERRHVLATYGTVAAVAIVLAVVATVVLISVHTRTNNGDHPDQLTFANSASPSPTAPESGSLALLVGHRWVPNAGSSPQPAASAYITFFPDGTWRGSDGCNAIGGTFSYSQTGSFTAALGGTTLKYCNVPQIADWLTAAAHAEVTDTELRLTAANGRELGVFTS